MRRRRAAFRRGEEGLRRAGGKAMAAETRCGGEDNGELPAMPANGGGGNGAVPGSAVGRGQ